MILRSFIIYYGRWIGVSGECDTVNFKLSLWAGRLVLTPWAELHSLVDLQPLLGNGLSDRELIMPFQACILVALGHH